MQNVPRTHASLSDPDLFAETRPLYWLWSTDARRIALLQLLGVLVAGLAGGLLGFALQVEKATPELSALSPHAFAAALSLHGSVMLFLVLLPAIPGGLGSFVLPSLIGARNVAFPRLHLLSVQLWTLGALCFLAAMGVGGAVSGWTLSVPLSLEAGSGAVWLAVGLAWMALSMLLRAVVLMTTILGMRRPGLTWSDASPLTWSLLAHGTVTLIAAPVLLGSVVALLSERAIGLGLFDPALGGDPLLFQNFFWFGMHALAYSAVVPAVGVLSHILMTHSPAGLCAPRSLLAGIVGLSIVSLLSWAIQTPTAGHGPAFLSFFSLFTLLGAVPVVQILGSWLLTLRGGHRVTPGSWFVLGAGIVFVVGTLSTLPLATLSTAVSLHGTAYEVAQTHLVFGSVALSAIAGLQHFWSDITGRVPASRFAAAGALLLTAGLLATFLPQLALGFVGLPRRMAEYPPPFSSLQGVSLAGMSVLFLGVVATGVSLIGSARAGRSS